MGPARGSARRCAGSPPAGAWTADAAERVLFALVAQRALEPGSKLAATRWVAERVAIAGIAGFSDDSGLRGMDFLLDALPDIAARSSIRWRTC